MREDRELPVFDLRIKLISIHNCIEHEKTSRMMHVGACIDNV